MSEKEIHVEIVSPVFNRREITLQCLRSLRRVDKTGLKIHVIIVDDGSTDGLSAAIASDFPEVEVVRGDGNLWFSGGANAGFRQALKYSPDYVLLINNDTVFDDKFLRYLVETAEKNPRTAVGGLLLLWDAPHKVFQVAPRFEIWYGGWRHFYKQTVWTVPDKPFEVEMLAGNCILFPAKVFSELGFFDERNFPHYADAQFTPLMRKKGWRLLVDPRARVFNQPNEYTSLKKMSFGQMYQALWGDLRKQQNLRSRWMMYKIAAPTKFHAAAAWLIHVVRLFSIPFGFNRNWATGNLRERPLKEEIRIKRF
jgi:GT2 family glycosyltransferase